MKRACEHCEWWQPGDRSDWLGEQGKGFCRVDPPLVSGFPISNHNDWCGQFRVAERLAGGVDVRTKGARIAL